MLTKILMVHSSHTAGLHSTSSTTEHE